MNAMSDRWLNTLLERVRSVTVAKGARVIAFTAPHEDAGTSLVASLFAKRLHETGVRTLLIDASLAASIDFGRHCWEPGDGSLLSSVQADPGGPDRLWLLIHPHDTGRFNDTQRLQCFFQKELLDYAVVVVDCRPAVAGSGGAVEASSIAEFADATVLVGKANVTLEHQNEAALGLLLQSNAKIAGVVINDELAPRFGAEISREAKRLEHIFPRLTRRISRWALSTAVLDVPA